MADVLQKAINANSYHNGYRLVKNGGAPKNFSTLAPPVNDTVDTAYLESKLTHRLDNTDFEVKIDT